MLEDTLGMLVIKGIYITSIITCHLAHACQIDKNSDKYYKIEKQRMRIFNVLFYTCFLCFYPAKQNETIDVRIDSSDIHEYINQSMPEIHLKRSWTIYGTDEITNLFLNLPGTILVHAYHKHSFFDWVEKELPLWSEPAIMAHIRMLGDTGTISFLEKTIVTNTLLSTSEATQKIEIGLDRTRSHWLKEIYPIEGYLFTEILLYNDQDYTNLQYIESIGSGNVSIHLNPDVENYKNQSLVVYNHGSGEVILHGNPSVSTLDWRLHSLYITNTGGGSIFFQSTVGIHIENVWFIAMGIGNIVLEIQGTLNCSKAILGTSMGHACVDAPSVVLTEGMYATSAIGGTLVLASDVHGSCVHELVGVIGNGSRISFGHLQCTDVTVLVVGDNAKATVQATDSLDGTVIGVSKGIEYIYRPIEYIGNLPKNLQKQERPSKAMKFIGHTTPESMQCDTMRYISIDQEWIPGHIMIHNITEICGWSVTMVLEKKTVFYTLWVLGLLAIIYLYWEYHINAPDYPVIPRRRRRRQRQQELTPLL